VAMFDRILDNVLKSVGTYPAEYENSVISEIDMYIDSSNLPIMYQKLRLDETKLPKNLKTFFKNVPKYLQEDESVIIFVNEFKTSGYISAMFYENILNDCLIADKHVPTVLYIDTNLLIEYFGYMMDASKGLNVGEQQLFLPDIVNNRIYTADVVIWDKFDYSKVAYANRKLYEILTIRYNRCLKNVFFVRSDTKKLIDKFGSDMIDVMNLNYFVDLSGYEKEDFVYKGDNK